MAIIIYCFFVIDMFVYLLDKKVDSLLIYIIFVKASTTEVIRLKVIFSRFLLWGRIRLETRVNVARICI